MEGTIYLYYTYMSIKQQATINFIRYPLSSKVFLLKLYGKSFIRILRSPTEWFKPQKGVDSVCNRR